MTDSIIRRIVILPEIHSALEMGATHSSAKTVSEQDGGITGHVQDDRTHRPLALIVMRGTSDDPKLQCFGPFYADVRHHNYLDIRPELSSGGSVIVLVDLNYIHRVSNKVYTIHDVARVTVDEGTFWACLENNPYIQARNVLNMNFPLLKKSCTDAKKGAENREPESRNGDTEIELKCIIEGDKIEEAFTVTAPHTASIGELKSIIKAKKIGILAKTQTKALKLRLINVDCRPAYCPWPVVIAGFLRGKELLQDEKTVVYYYGIIPTYGQIHVLVQRFEELF
ncbi:hypothetical protein BGZ75_004937 [Mortierella antarctica]|nr:hypothetical protein BGZ75_004937 [Mortierella antarctica]